MSDDNVSYPWGEAEEDLTANIDTSVPVSARIWNYWMGGKDYYPVDKDAGDQYAAVYPGVFDLARASRYFTARVARFLAGGAGIRQFLDIGTGLPSHDNTHEIVQRVAPDSRVVYVDNDPLVLTHARALLRSSGTSSTDYIDADLNEPDSILAAARDKLDFAQPLAIMLMGILGHIGDPAQDDDRFAQSVVATLRNALPPGGYLAINEAVDTDPEANAAQAYYNQTGAVPYHIRSRENVVRFFNGLALVDPGIVPIQEWRTDPNPFNLASVPAVGGVGKRL